MLIDNSRLKLINAIIYFTTNTKYCLKTKLIKLLYFLDFEHYKEIGRSVTSLNYYAWPQGPVPKTLYNEFDNPTSDLLEYFKIETTTHKDREITKIIPLKEFEEKYFTKRELRILQSLAIEYKNTKTDGIVEETHLENLPWNKVYNIENKKQSEIPYEYAIINSEKEILKKVANEHLDFINNYK